MTPAFHGSCKKFNIKPKQPVTDVQTRWGSTYNMLKWSIEFRKPINNVCENRKYGHMEVKEDEWDTL